MRNALTVLIRVVKVFPAMRKGANHLERRVSEIVAREEREVGA